MPDFGPRWILVSNSPLGNGGQAQVYRVRDAQSPDSPEMVAKIMRGADDPARRSRLEHEIAVAKHFDHPNVVRVVDSGHTVGSNYPYYVMPYYGGRSLADKEPPLAEPIDIL